MKEISYRAWLIEEKVMIIVSNINLSGETVDGYDEYDNFYEGYGFDKIELMQYTGLKDKNGKEIYEGYIVTFEDAECDAEGYHDNVFLNRGVVSYDKTSMCYSFTNRQTVDMDDLYIPDDVEVIGNIHDNPELLEV